MTAALKPAFQDRQSYPIAPTRQGSSTRSQAPSQIVQFPSRAEVIQQRRGRTVAGSLAINTATATLSVAKPVRKPAGSVRSLPTPQQQPSWLKALVWAQRSSIVLATVAVGATFAVYGWTVQTQQQWGKEFSRQEQLQRRERQLIEANAALAQQLAEQAEQSGTNLTVPTDANTAFLPTPIQVAPPPAVVAPVALNSGIPPVRPMGY